MKKIFFLYFLFLIGCNNNSEKLEPKFSSINKNFFSKKCALYTCHSEAYYQKSGNLDLSYSNAYKNLINIPSKLYPKRLRVKPGKPNESVIINRLEGTLICGESVERHKITNEEIVIVRKWIENGAFRK